MGIKPLLWNSQCHENHFFPRQPRPTGLPEQVRRLYLGWQGEEDRLFGRQPSNLLLYDDPDDGTRV